MRLSLCRRGRHGNARRPGGKTGDGARRVGLRLRHIRWRGQIGGLFHIISHGDWRLLRRPAKDRLSDQLWKPSFDALSRLGSALLALDRMGNNRRLLQLVHDRVPGLAWSGRSESGRSGKDSNRRAMISREALLDKDHDRFWASCSGGCGRLRRPRAGVPVTPSSMEAWRAALGLAAASTPPHERDVAFLGTLLCPRTLWAS